MQICCNSQPNKRVLIFLYFYKMDGESFLWSIMGFCVLYCLTWMLPWFLSFLLLNIFEFLFKVIGVNNDNLLMGISIIPWVLHAYLLIDFLFIRWIIPEFY
jgi:hypothetical protein